MKSSAFDKNVQIAWEAPDVENHERGLTWKIIMSVSIVVVVILGIIFDNWTFSLAILAFAITYYLTNFQKPKIVEIKISNMGVKVGNKKYAYSQIKNFWIIYEPPHTSTLHLTIKEGLLNHVTIQLQDQDPAEVREFLRHKTKELKGKTLSLTSIILKLLKI